MLHCSEHANLYSKNKSQYQGQRLIDPLVLSRMQTKAARNRLIMCLQIMCVEIVRTPNFFGHLNLSGLYFKGSFYRGQYWSHHYISLPSFCCIITYHTRLECFGGFQVNLAQNKPVVLQPIDASCEIRRRISNQYTISRKQSAYWNFD